jgi:hypothetical protein
MKNNNYKIPAKQPFKRLPTFEGANNPLRG